MDSPSILGLLAESCSVRTRCRREDSRVPDLSHALPVLDATLFLYPSVEDAENGANFGGSGVVIGVPLGGRQDLFARFAVTNWHVACGSGASVIRLHDANTGKRHILDLDPSEWTFIPGGPDLAIAPLFLPHDINPTLVPSFLFIDAATEGDVFPGDDVFMAGRFIDYDGHETNKPALRFGTVSIIGATVLQPTRYNGPSYIVDVHSRTGFSGSPAYVYRPGTTTSVAGKPIMSMGDFSTPSKRSWGMGNDTNLKLLGIQWGQFPEQWEIGKKAKQETAEAPLVTEGAYVTGFSGMSCVIPATDILRVLALPELVKFQKPPPPTFSIPMLQNPMGAPYATRVTARPAASAKDEPDGGSN